MKEAKGIKTLETQIEQQNESQIGKEIEVDIDESYEALYLPPFIDKFTDLKGFAEGIDDYVKFAGAFSILVSGGMTNAQAWEFIITNETNKTSLEISRINAQSKAKEQQSNSF